MIAISSPAPGRISQQGNHAARLDGACIGNEALGGDPPSFLSPHILAPLPVLRTRTAKCEGHFKEWREQKGGGGGGQPPSQPSKPPDYGTSLLKPEIYCPLP